MNVEKSTDERMKIKNWHWNGWCRLPLKKNNFSLGFAMKSMNEDTRQTRWFPKRMGTFKGKVLLSLLAHKFPRKSIGSCNIVRKKWIVSSFQTLKSVPGEKTNRNLHIWWHRSRFKSSEPKSCSFS